ncbi:MAG TPA: trifunctional transcriptional regulator/proline dehydrogenase/L-glutamate gamma-semialdehyde dehydrogenase [Usitatibacter sp.]|nr:trifunctional transcriptional regulator/proline dehydrogenase/L-glutamate gamma-semialdehyde dehydrogenase [Usitatibacter sp.]
MDQPLPPREFPARLPERSRLRRAITAARRRPEPECVPPLLPAAQLDESRRPRADALARRLVAGLRARPFAAGREGLVQGLLQEFSLSSDEGVALMCLAEALLRIPDPETRDALIRDKVARGNWRAHLGQSASPFVNAAAWGLLITGRLVATHDEARLANGLTRVTARMGEPVVRKAVDVAMRLMGKQFVAGETIEDALGNAARYEAIGFRYSYDMLGEAAMTQADAARYLASYEQAIDAIGAASAGRGVHDGPGISIKLSALHPRYTYGQHARVMAELYPRVRDLVLRARGFDIGINMDAEEADRLEPSLDLLEALCEEPALEGWAGIGFVVQAYQKRCPFVIDFLVDLARRTRRRLMVRLVKGAYWDSEIKRAQVEGLDGYPVYTRKVHTDVSYLACARRLLDARDAIYPQFATHNAQTLATVYEMAGPWEPARYEFQCLHGMGESLYTQIVGPPASGKLGVPCRIYAPVGTHETLLAYLVRRLLENGANTSFINRIADPRVCVDELVAEPVETVRRIGAETGTLGAPHPRIPLPRLLFGELRANSSGMDLTDEAELARLAEALAQSRTLAWEAAPTLGVVAAPDRAAVRNPADPDDIVGHVIEARGAEVEAALRAAEAAAGAWRETPPASRATVLLAAADALEARMPLLVGLIVREAGKTYANAVAEVREAVDFLRYYATQARDRFDSATHVPLGPVACISPWNFPLAIFTGQVSAALAAGNPVLAKPAEQTPLIAAEAVRLIHAAGVPRGVLQLLPGRGETVGAALVADPRVQGVVFTGSTEVARIIQRTLAARVRADGLPVPLVAETGGQNAMIVDSSALAEQVVADAVVSAFDSAGQRCSALRVLCLQEEVADRFIEMLEGATAELRIGDPRRLDTDVGPVIDAAAREALLRHIDRMRAEGQRVTQDGSQLATAARAAGHFVAPTIVHLDNLSRLDREMFGPVLHVVRYRREGLDRLVDGINALGYGLTLGVHSRVDRKIDRVVGRARAGNIYVNRNIVGAVVGVQPFGGEGLSGTGPKAGGPLYLYRLLASHPAGAALAELAAMANACDGPQPPRANPSDALEALRDWALRESPDLAACCDRLAALTPVGDSVPLPGPTGERNTYSLVARETILGLAEGEHDLLSQLALALALGSRVLWPRGSMAEALRARVPEVVRDCITLVDDWTQERFDAVLHHGTAGDRTQVLRRLATRDGPIVNLCGFAPGEEPLTVERLLVERVVSVNTAAAGGNASLMTIG